MARIAAFASVIALCASIFAYSVTHWGFPAIGFEGAAFFGGVALWVGAITAGLATLICFERWLQKRSRLHWPFVFALVAVIVLAATVRT